MADVLRDLEAELKKQIGEISQWLVSTGAADFSDYRYHLGKIHGIQMAIEALAEVRQAVEEDDD